MLREILFIFIFMYVILFKINVFNFEIYERYFVKEKIEKLFFLLRKKKVILEVLFMFIRKILDNVCFIGIFLFY